MATLHVRNVPDKLYQRIKRLAEAQNRSLSAEVSTLLDQAVDAEERSVTQSKLLADAKRLRESLRWAPSFPDSVTLLREDRDR